MRQAFILVGGKGTRLGAATAHTPKPLLPIKDERVFLDYVLAFFARGGVEEIILSAGHLGEQFEARYQGAAIGGARIQIVREPAPAGTAGALLYARERLDPVFLMANGDSLFECDLAALEAALGPHDIAALALRRVGDGARYGNVAFADGRINAFREKIGAGEALISAGLYALRREALDFIAAPPCSIETDIFPPLAAQGRLAGVAFDGYFIDIGLPDTLEQARRELPMRFGA